VGWPSSETTWGLILQRSKFVVQAPAKNRQDPSEAGPNQRFRVRSNSYRDLWLLQWTGAGSGRNAEAREAIPATHGSKPNRSSLDRGKTRPFSATGAICRWGGPAKTPRSRPPSQGSQRKRIDPEISLSRLPLRRSQDRANASPKAKPVGTPPEIDAKQGPCAHQHPSRRSAVSWSCSSPLSRA